LPYGAPIHVLYTHSFWQANGIEPDFLPADRLSYQDGSRNQLFSGGQIGESDTPLGTVLTVELSQTVDIGSTTFSLILPHLVDPTSTAPQSLTTLGLTGTWSGPDTVPKPVQDVVYSAILLVGSFTQQS